MLSELRIIVLDFSFKDVNYVASLPMKDVGKKFSLKLTKKIEYEKYLLKISVTYLLKFCIK